MKAFVRIAAIALIAAFVQPALAQTRATQPYGVSRPIADRYIVVFQDHVADPSDSAARLTQTHGGRLHHAYGHAIKGFAATLSASAVAALRHHPDVAYVEQDQTISLQQTSPQNQATWGLDRIDQVDLPLDTQYNFSQSGAGVTAYVVDTGIRADHVEFTGRVLPGYTAINDGQGTNDCNGHGTHVSGTIAGTTWGVAKGAALVPVRVMDCTGSGAWSQVIAGLDWVAAQPARPAVANMSLGGSASSTLDAAVARVVAAGVTVVVAAGNSNVDACTTSPAREPSALTVGATMNNDSRASFSNYGSCQDLFGPGYAITSAGYSSPTASAVMSGTSMASPHVAGTVALILQASPTATAAAVASTIKSYATVNHVFGAGTGSPNLLVNTHAASAPVVQPPKQTVAFKAMAGSGIRSGGNNWKATVSVTVRDVSTGAAVPLATVTGKFSAGGSTSCVTGSTGACSVTSATVKSGATPSISFTGTGISGTLLQYDATQNSATQVVVSAP